MGAAARQKAVLAIGAQPVDVAYFCAGTLALFQERNWRVVPAAVTGGEEAVPAVLEAEWQCLFSPSFSIFFGKEPCQRVAGLIRAAQPDLLLTHSMLDRVPDHEETGRIVRQACVAAAQKNYKVTTFPGGERPLKSLPHLYYFDSTEGKDFLGRGTLPSVIVDVSSARDVKEQTLRRVAGQHERERLLERMRGLGKQRGAQIGCPSAEVFRQHLDDGCPTNDLLRETLGELARAAS